MCTMPVTELVKTNKLEIGCDLNELPGDLKRVLRVQFKEFMHFLDDANCETAGNSFGSRKLSA